MHLYLRPQDRRLPLWACSPTLGWCMIDDDDPASANNVQSSAANNVHSSAANNVHSSAANNVHSSAANNVQSSGGPYRANNVHRSAARSRPTSATCKVQSSASAPNFNIDHAAQSSAPNNVHSSAANNVQSSAPTELAIKHRPRDQGRGRPTSANNVQRSAATNVSGQSSVTNNGHVQSSGKARRMLSDARQLLTQAAGRKLGIFGY